MGKTTKSSGNFVGELYSTQREVTISENSACTFSNHGLSNIHGVLIVFIHRHNTFDSEHLLLLYLPCIQALSFDGEERFCKKK